MVRVLDQSAYALAVFKVRFGPLALKLYDKGPRVLRVEAIAHNVKGRRLAAKSWRNSRSCWPSVSEW